MAVGSSDAEDRGPGNGPQSHPETDALLGIAPTTTHLFRLREVETMDGPVSERDALHDHTVELETTDPPRDGDGLVELCEGLVDANIVALGEGTHGTREFFELKHRIVRELVETHGLRTFAIEAGVGEAKRVNEYVQDGDGDVEDAIAGMNFWTWNTDEVLAFVEWFRDFNRDRSRDDQVSFWGVDVQYAAASADAVAGFLERVDAVDDIDGLEKLARNGLHEYATETDETTDLDRARDIATATEGCLDTRRDALIAAASEREYALARQHARTVGQAVEYATLRADAGAGEPNEDSASYRDRAMADNAEWIVEHVDDDQLVLWAHNDHVKRGTMTCPAVLEDVQTAGDRLAERHGDDYHPLGFAFGHGSFQAIGDLPDAEKDRGLRSFTVERPTRDSLEATLASLGGDVVALDLDDARDDHALAEWVATPRDCRSIGAFYDHEDADDYWGTYDLERDFDTIVYVDETTRARPIE